MCYCLGRGVCAPVWQRRCKSKMVSSLAGLSMVYAPCFDTPNPSCDCLSQRSMPVSRTPRLLIQTSLLGLQAAEPLPPAVIKAIAKELKELQEKPEEGIKVCPGFTRDFGHSMCTRSHSISSAVDTERGQYSRRPGRIRRTRCAAVLSRPCLAFAAF